MDKIIIDTSAWIDSFRPGENQGLSLVVKDLILKDRVLLPGIIKAELLRGARTKNEFNPSQPQDIVIFDFDVHFYRHR